MNFTTFDWISLAFFSLAFLHTLSVSRVRKFAVKRVSISTRNLFHLLSEVELVFGFWALIYLAVRTFALGFSDVMSFLETLHFKEPLFVFAMIVAASLRPVLRMVKAVVIQTARVLPGRESTNQFFVTLVLGPLLGSIITEPAAMTVTAILLKDYLRPKATQAFKYAVLSTLLVNISIGGVLTHFAAPPVLMVSTLWNWNSFFMLKVFGWKAALAVVLNTILVTLFFRNEVGGAWRETSEEFPPIKFREGLYVAFFLAGLVVLGSPQGFWVSPLLNSLNDLSMFFGAAMLTALIDNAALTYLGAQAPHLSESLKYFLVAGAISGGGLTVIANAPNPIGLSILKEKFEDSGVSQLRLFVAALVPTAVAMFCFFIL